MQYERLATGQSTLQWKLIFQMGKGKLCEEVQKEANAIFHVFDRKTPPMFGWTKGRTDEQRKSGHVHNSFFCVCLFQYNLFLGQFLKRCANSPKTSAQLPKMHHHTLHNNSQFKNRFQKSFYVFQLNWCILVGRILFEEGNLTKHGHRQMEILQIHQVSWFGME